MSALAALAPPIMSNVDRSIRISFRLGGLRSMKVAIAFSLGWGREGVSEEVETLGEAPPLLKVEYRQKFISCFLYLK